MIMVSKMKSFDKHIIVWGTIAAVVVYVAKNGWPFNNQLPDTEFSDDLGV